MQFPQLLKQSLIQGGHLGGGRGYFHQICITGVAQLNLHFVETYLNTPQWLFLTWHNKETARTSKWFTIERKEGNSHPLTASRHISAKSSKLLEELSSVCHAPSHLFCHHHLTCFVIIIISQLSLSSSITIIISQLSLSQPGQHLSRVHLFLHQCRSTSQKPPST